MSKQFKANAIYFFRYKNPAGKGKLKIWDSAPLIIPLDITKKSLLAVNLHWINDSHRAEFVEYLLKYFEEARLGKKRITRSRLYYNFIKAGKIKYALVAIRRYHISRITNLQEVKREDWPKVLKTRKYKAKFKYDSFIHNMTRAFRNPTRRK